MDSNHNATIAAFIEVTGATDTDAEAFLKAHQWNLDPAVANYFQDMEADGQGPILQPDSDDIPDDASEPTPPQPSAPAPGGGYRLGNEGDPVQQAPASTIAAPSSKGKSKKPAQNKKFGTLRDLQGDGGHAGHGHDDDDEYSEKEQEYYAGGDKSGLAVQDPGERNASDHIKRLMNTAKKGAPRPPRGDGLEDESPARPSYFGGAGQTLGGDDVESRQIPSTQPQRPPAREMVERTLHLWDDGFSIDDGPLYRFDDPNNRRTLDMINSGSAPMDLMGVQSGQAVDVKLEQHHGEKYKQPKKKYKPFDGGGQRLGSPTPGVASSAPAPVPSAPAPTTSSSNQTSAAPTMNIDESQPTINMRVQLGDGTRLPVRVNPSQTIGHLYDFVDRASPGQQRPYVLATTFPNKDWTDKSTVLSDTAELKRGGVVVQKWV